MRFKKTILAFFVALFMISLAGCASTEKHSSAAEYIDDAVITTKVKAALFGDPDLSAAEINVETYNGEVQLKMCIRDSSLPIRFKSSISCMISSIEFRIILPGSVRPRIRFP